MESVCFYPQLPDPCLYFFFGESAEFDNLRFRPEFRRDHLHRRLTIAHLDNRPTRVHASFAAPIGIRKEMPAVSSDRVQYPYADFMVALVS